MKVLSSSPTFSLQVPCGKRREKTPTHCPLPSPTQSHALKGHTEEMIHINTLDLGINSVGKVLGKQTESDGSSPQP